MFKKLMLAVLMVCLLMQPLSILASANDLAVYPVEGGNLYFDKSTGEIIDCDRGVISAIIPESIGGIEVTGIGFKAFDWCSGLEAVRIPQSVKEIGDFAFFHCSTLREIIIAEGVEHIRNSAFEYCGFTSVTVPASTKSIGDRAFASCRELTSVGIMGKETVLGEQLFADCYSLDTVVLTERLSFNFNTTFLRCWSLRGVLIAADPPVMWTEPAFKDVTPSDWFFEDVEYVVRHGLFYGTNQDSFSPDSAMTRAMFITVLWRYADGPSESEKIFDDVDPDSWYGTAVTWAKRAGIVSGVSESRFNPNDKITREQMASILFRYSQHFGLHTEIFGSLKGFSDASLVSEYATDAMSWAVGCGVINGITATELNPGGFTTRAQAAAVLARFDRYYERSI